MNVSESDTDARLMLLLVLLTRVAKLSALRRRTSLICSARCSANGVTRDRASCQRRDVSCAMCVRGRSHVQRTVTTAQIQEEERPEEDDNEEKVAQGRV